MVIAEKIRLGRNSLLSARLKPTPVPGEVRSAPDSDTEADIVDGRKVRAVSRYSRILICLRGIRPLQRGDASIGRSALS
jgi:hypothetical protein